MHAFVGIQSWNESRPELLNTPHTSMPPLLHRNKPDLDNSVLTEWKSPPLSSNPSLVHAAEMAIKPKNEWLNAVLEEWNASPISRITPLHVAGKAIIEKLVSLTLLLPQVLNDDLTIIALGQPICGPVGLIIADLLQLEPCEHNVWDVLSYTS